MKRTAQGEPLGQKPKRSEPEIVATSDDAAGDEQQFLVAPSSRLQTQCAFKERCLQRTQSIEKAMADGVERRTKGSGKGVVQGVAILASAQCISAKRSTSQHPGQRSLHPALSRTAPSATRCKCCFLRCLRFKGRYGGPRGDEVFSHPPAHAREEPSFKYAQTPCRICDFATRRIATPGASTRCLGPAQQKRPRRLQTRR